MPPRYIAIAAITLDGKIALNAKHTSTWTSPEDKIFLHAMLDSCDVIVVGRHTYETAKKPIQKRNCIVLTRSVTGVVQKRENLVFINPHRGRLTEHIATHHYKTIAVLGGSQIYTYCLEHNLIDELYLTIESVIFGTGIPLFDGKATIRKPRVISIKRLNKSGTVLIHIDVRCSIKT